jgi:RNA polymerase sigma factor for flagellar operon FliA
MSDRASAEALFLEHRATIEKIAAIACGKRGMWDADAEDFTSWLMIQLMEDDYAVLRGFQGKAGMKTYLAAVVARLFSSYTRMQRGRWRPSAAAERMGTPALELERLVLHEGYTLPQAGEKLRTAGVTTLSDTELARLLDKLPLRGPLRPVEVADPTPVIDLAHGASRADERVVAAEAKERRQVILDALSGAMAHLEREDQLIVKMHFADGFSLAQVARTLGLEQKPLYRRVERLRVRLRKLLEDAGLRADDVLGLPEEPEGQ